MNARRSTTDRDIIFAVVDAAIHNGHMTFEALDLLKHAFDHNNTPQEAYDILHELTTRILLENLEIDPLLCDALCNLIRLFFPKPKREQTK